MYAGDALSIPSETTLAPQRALLGAPIRPVTITDHSELVCIFHAPDSLSASIAAQWTMLSDQAAEPNSFAERWFLQPALALLADAADIEIAVVTSHSGLLVGLMPLTVRSAYGPIPVTNVQNWMHHNSFLGVPLIRRGMEAQFWTALLAGLDEASWAKGLFHVRGLTANGRAMRGLETAAAQLGRRCDIVQRTRRALLSNDRAQQDYRDADIHKKKRKERDRLADRLGDMGTLRYTTLARGDDAEPWIDAFLGLERDGCKGRTGSAPAKFIHIAAAGAHAAGKLDVHRLDLDGKPIAMLINFLAAPGGFSFKIALDERYARYSPEALIERHNLRILERRNIDWLDSSAARNDLMIDSPWSQYRDIASASVPLGGTGAGLVFRASRFAEKAISRLRRQRSDGSIMENPAPLQYSELGSA